MTASGAGVGCAGACSGRAAQRDAKRSHASVECEGSVAQREFADSCRQGCACRVQGLKRGRREGCGSLVKEEETSAEGTQTSIPAAMRRLRRSSWRSASRRGAATGRIPSHQSQSRSRRQGEDCLNQGCSCCKQMLACQGVGRAHGPVPRDWHNKKRWDVPTKTLCPHTSPMFLVNAPYFPRCRSVAWLGRMLLKCGRW